VRRAPALIVAAALLLVTLSGCSSSPATGTNCDNAAQPGDASKLVTVSGEFGSKPKVSLPTPIYTKTTQASVNIQGTGAELVKGQEAVIDFEIYSGSTGKLVGSSSWGSSGGTSIVVGKSGVTGLDHALLCHTVGSRLAIAIAPKQGFGSSGASVGLGATDTAIMVVDIKKAYLDRANGTPQPRQQGFPIVVLAPNGQPGVNVPTTAPPSDLRIAVLKAGHGAKVKEGDEVVTNYTGILWKERTVFDSTWTSGEPATLKASYGKNGVVPGFASAIIGQKVGSQILVIVPPDKGYGAAGSSDGTIPAHATLIFVIDILGVA
jgi:FKBP-type peptidyl-prolyl cis-trans isomerase